MGSTSLGVSAARSSTARWLPYLAANAANHRRGTKRSAVERPSAFALLCVLSTSIFRGFFDPITHIFITIIIISEIKGISFWYLSASIRGVSLKIFYFANIYP